MYICAKLFEWEAWHLNFVGDKPQTLQFSSCAKVTWHQALVTKEIPAPPQCKLSVHYGYFNSIQFSKMQPVTRCPYSNNEAHWENRI